MLIGSIVDFWKQEIDPMKKFRQLFTCLLLVISLNVMFVSSVSFAAADEEGPLITKAVVTSNSSLKSGDVISIVITMYDPGGAGIRNTQFVLADKFGRQHGSYNGNDCGSECKMFKDGDASNEITYLFRVDETWGTDGYVTMGNMRIYDKLSNGTYFYADGTFQNLQTNRYYDGKHQLSNLRLALGNPPPDSTTSTTSTSTTSTTVVTVGSTAPTINLPTPVSTSIPSTLTVTLSKVVSAKSIAADAKLAVTSTSKVSLKVLSSSAKYCKVSGTTLKGLKAGSCKVTVTVTPKKGRATSKTISLKITK